ncbi:MAG: hypothetical protein ACYDEZ_09865, partial [Methanoregula sp.]
CFFLTSINNVQFLSFFKKTILFFRAIKRVLPLGMEKNSKMFFAASFSGEQTVPNGNQRLEKNGTFFVKRERGRPHYCRRK